MTETTGDERVVLLGAPPTQGALWAPATGLATERLRSLLLDTGELPDDAAFQRLQKSALRILAQCAPPTGATARRTGLVVGYVQSGKTMSMTSVAAVARDNGFRLVIVFAGVTTILQSQSRTRFENHLLPEGQHPKLWRMLDSQDPKQLARETEAFLATLREWNDAARPDDRKRSLFITVMKNHKHLNKLAELLKHVDLSGVPALIIDDEADQAGLNTSLSGPEASTTHRCIAAVRALLPHHSYLQYTATPQAPLLISLIDMLSPEFAEILEPGKGYTGGATFFAPGTRLSVSLPTDELFPPGSPPSEVPETLKKAMREFFVGTAVSELQRKKSPWSMLIHPSQLRDDHEVYLGWAQRVQREWAELLLQPDGDLDRADLVNEMRAAYDELFPDPCSYPTFEEVLAEIRSLVGAAVVTSVNSENGDEIKWRNADAHILVGGEKLNRGFTVRGLTVTYMPRGPGGWNADTLQQRARFFGYKQGYIDRCRVYLHPDLHRAFRDYVQHEIDVRRRLDEWRGRPLKEWKRAFFLDGALRPTRANVLNDPFYKVKTTKSWYTQDQPHESSIYAENRALADALFIKYAFEPFHDDDDAAEPHTSSVVPIQSLLEDFLVPYDVRGEHDIKWFYAVRVWLEELARTGSQQVRVVRMRSGPRAARVREAKNGKIVKLLQGRSSKQDANTYRGDAEVKDGEFVTIQAHELIVKDQDSGQEIDGVVALAVHIPTKLSQVIVQPPKSVAS